MHNFFQDLRYALRQIRKSPGFALVAIIMLALGIGANTAMFSVMSSVLLRYLPARDPQQLVFLHYADQPEGTAQTGYDDTSLPEPVFEEIRTHHEIFSDVVAFAPLTASPMPVRYGATPEEARGDMVSGSYFSSLGVNAVCGRMFSPEDEKTHAPVLVLSNAYWSRRFSRDAAVIDKPLYVKGIPFTIVGVASPGFLGTERDKATDFWVPLQDRSDLKPWGASPSEKDLSLYGAPHWFFLMMIGRLAPGVTQQQALAHLQPIYQSVAYAGLKARDPKKKPSEIYFTNARGIEGVRDSYKRPLTILMYMVAVVLAIACANVSMLLIARNTPRQREFGIRIALGSSNWRLFTQLLTESLLLVGAGAALGCWFAVLATNALARWSDLDVSLAPDRTVLLFTATISLIVALIFGLTPLRSVTRVPAGLTLKSSSPNATQDRTRLRAGQLVVALQIATCVVLLVAATLLVRTMRNLNTANLGMRTAGLVVFNITPPPNVRTDDDAVRFYTSLLDRLRTLPAIDSATVIATRLGSGWSNNTLVKVDGRNPLGDKLAPVRWNPVGPDFLNVLGTPLLIGRDIAQRDTAATPKVAIINQTFAERYLKRTTPIGHHIELEGNRGAYTIIGVFPDLKFTKVRETSRPMAFVPYTQVSGISNMTIELRTTSDFGSIMAEVRRMLHDISPDLAPLQAMTQQEQFNESYSDDRLFSRLALFFGVLAALLVATGLFGTLAYRVNRSVSEIGIRMALGAQRQQVLWMVLRESLIVTLVGVAVGLPLAIAASRLLRSMLFSVSPGDPISFVAALAGMALITLLASAIPARRASSVDPIVALRYE
jgi:predicted permease